MQRNLAVGTLVVAVDVRVATRQQGFERRTIDRATYATAWDGDVRVLASERGVS